MGARQSACLVALLFALAGCGGGGGGGNGSGNGGIQPGALDTELYNVAKTSLGLTGDPATSRGASQVLPEDDPLVKLGQLLFFSQTLSAGYDVSCATCHHPDFGFSDGLSISVGVAPVHSAAVGPGREIDPMRDLDPSADGGPNMHRNSLTTANAALFDRVMMYDGRVQVLEDLTVPGGHGQQIQTPESGQRPDLTGVDGLMEFTTKGPIVNDNEMRGFLYTEFATAAEYRSHLVNRLRGTVDAQFNPNPDAAENWLGRFRAAFGDSDAIADSIITIENVQRALAAFVDSKVFVDNPWQRYLDGDDSAISIASKRGALLFLQSQEEGGLGCAECHSGDRFTDEQFHNVAFPQIGRGFQRSDHTDLGRWTTTRLDNDLQAFRTPSLLNVALTAPYGHAGTFETIAETIRYHADPDRAVDTFDFQLLQLPQFSSGTTSYPYAEAHTRTALTQPSFQTVESRLPLRSLTTTEVGEVVAFLETLTDSCLITSSCVNNWLPDPEDDPDGHMLIRDVSHGTPPDVGASGPSDYPEQISLEFPTTTPRTTFADVLSCSDSLAAPNNTGELTFVRRSEPGFGLDDPHGYSYETWFERQSSLEVAMVGGGVSSAYLDDDCWPDLVFTSGAVTGMRFYRNVSGTFFETIDLIDTVDEVEFSGASISDLNGDFRRELVLGNIKPGEIPIYAENGTGQFMKIAALPMIRPTYGISFAPLDESGLPYFYLGHWASGSGTDGGSPALWKSDGTSVSPWDVTAATSPASVDQRFNFTPKFADFTGDGLIDLVIASDFLTSAVLRNAGSASAPSFVNETDREVITDQNGMGSTLLDIDNDGNLEWFVTSILEDPSSPPLGNWGQTGNRLYRNDSTLDSMAFEDITTEAGVRDGAWGWGACAADINNDGFVDIFHVNGFGYIPDDVAVNDLSIEAQTHLANLTGNFRQRPSRLFINQGDGSFSEQAADWSIDAPSEGRGLTCFDFDRDGDIDIAVFDHSTGLQFFENKAGVSTDRHFVNIRLVGQPPNTDAIGARVYATADLGNGAGRQTQLRLSEANSNFNSQNLPDIHFGLGAATVIEELRVVWPDQSESICMNVGVDRFLVLDQRDGDLICP